MTERELVERLRELRQFYNERPAVRELPRMAEISVAECSDIGSAFGEAADALTRQAEEIERLRGALELVDQDVKHHLRSDEVSPAIIRTRAIAAVRAALSPASEQEVK